MVKRYEQNEIKEMAEILRNDGVLSVPTDTVYGLCARMDSENAEENLREVKNRPATKAFPIMCADLDQIRTIAEVDETAEKIIRAFMPGPLTVILRKKENIPAYVNGGQDTLAIRMATSDALRKLIEELGCPVFMTSANQSGEKTAETLDEIEQACPKLAGMMKGETKFGKASTILNCAGDLRVLREGPIQMEEIQALLHQ